MATMAFYVLVPGSKPSRADIIYVSNYANNSIEKYDSITGADLGFFVAGLSGPEGLAFDRGGNLYVANINNNTIRRFSPNGTDLGVFASANLPVGLAFDNTGNLYAVNGGGLGTVQKFTPTGTDLGTFASGAGLTSELTCD